MTITSAEPAFAALRGALIDRTGRGERFADLSASRDDGTVRLSAYVVAPGRIDALEATLPPGATGYPSLTPAIGAAFWYERLIHDQAEIVPGSPRSSSPAPLSRHVAGYGLFTFPHGPVRSG